MGLLEVFRSSTNPMFGHACIAVLVLSIISLATNNSIWSFLSVQAWVYVNFLSWLGTELLWIWKYDSKENVPKAALVMGVLALYTIFCSLVIIPAVPDILGITTFAIFYGPALLTFLYPLLFTPMGKNLAANIPWEVLMLATTYRYVMEIPWGIGIDAGVLPGGLAMPYQTTAPYMSTTFNASFSKGLCVDGLFSAILGPIIGAIAAYKGASFLPTKVYVGYLIFGMGTLFSAIFLVISFLPGNNIFGIWSLTSADTGAFKMLPGLFQAYLGSTFGFVIFVIGVRKALSK